MVAMKIMCVLIKIITVICRQRKNTSLEVLPDLMTHNLSWRKEDQLSSEFLVIIHFLGYIFCMFNWFYVTLNCMRKAKMIKWQNFSKRENLPRAIHQCSVEGKSAITETKITVKTGSEILFYKTFITNTCISSMQIL